MNPVFVPSSGRPDSSTVTEMVAHGLRPTVVLAHTELPAYVPVPIRATPEDVRGAYRAQFGNQVAYLTHDEFGMGPIRQRIAEAAGGPHWQVDDDMHGVFQREHVTDRWQRTDWATMLTAVEEQVTPEVGLAGPVRVGQIMREIA